MRRFSRHGPLALAGLLLGAVTAHAEFYDLAGRYECLEKPGTVCYDATPSLPDPTPPPQPGAQTGTDHATPSPAAAGKPAPSGKAEAPPAPPPDPFKEAVARVQSGKPTPADLAMLRTRAGTGDARALEILAWCEFTGLGVERDPVRAYFLYGQAAAAGAPRGRDNQAAIYEHALSSDQRQQVLNVENNLIPR